jgi:hypothetical protein
MRLSQVYFFTILHTFCSLLIIHPINHCINSFIIITSASSPSFTIRLDLPLITQVLGTNHPHRPPRIPNSPSHLPPPVSKYVRFDYQLHTGYYLPLVSELRISLPARAVMKAIRDETLADGTQDVFGKTQVGI